MKNITIKKLAMIVVIFLLYFTSAIHGGVKKIIASTKFMRVSKADTEEEMKLKKEKEKELRQKEIDFKNDPFTELTALENEILKNKNAVILRDISWESAGCPVNQEIQISYDYTFHITDSKKFSPIKDLEKKINQLYKYTKSLKHIEIPEKEYWYLKISGQIYVGPLPSLGTTVWNCSTYLQPVILYIPISETLLHWYVATRERDYIYTLSPANQKVTLILPEINENLNNLNQVLDFGKFAYVKSRTWPYPSNWVELTMEHLSLIKLFLFSQNMLRRVDLYNTLLDLQVLETLQTQLLKTTTECNLCPYGHSTHKVHREVEGFTCNICKIHCGGFYWWKRLECTACHTVMCEPCFKTKSKFGPNTKKELKNYLQKQNGKEYSEMHILSEFFTYIKQINWKIYLFNENSMEETPDTSMESTHAKILNLGSPEHLKNCSEDTKKLWRRLSVDYHKFLIDTRSDNWTYQLQIEKTIIDFIEIQWKCIEIIPAGVTQTKTRTVGYTNETTVSTTTTDSKNYSWSVKIDVPNFGELSYEKTRAQMEDKMNSVVTNYTEETIYEQQIASSDVERSIYILTFIGKIRSSGDTIEVKNPKKIKMIDSSDPVPLVDYEKEFMTM